MYRNLACISVLLLAAACAAPNTQRPTYSKTEVQQEAAEQQRAVRLANARAFDNNQSYTNPQLSAFSKRLDTVAGKVEPAASSLCRDVTKAACQYKVQFAPREKGVNAHADGNNVVVYPALIDFAQDDNQLAFVISHEFAHNILGHVASQKQNVMGGGLLGTILDVAAASQGYDTSGQFGKIGGNIGMLRYSQDFEEEADYVGLYILARAGYKIEDAPNFWRAMSLSDPDGIYGSSVGTHPSNSTRYIAMNKAIAEIRAKQQAGLPVVPNFQQQK